MSEEDFYNTEVPYDVFLSRDCKLFDKNTFVAYLFNFNGHHFYFQLAKTGMMVIVPYSDVDAMVPRKKQYYEHFGMLKEEK